MQTGKKSLLVLTSGGDAPGMNAAIRAVVRTAHGFGFTPFGVKHGYQGLVNEDLMPMTLESVGNCIQRGGTILKTARCLEFKNKNVRKKAINFLKEKNIEYLVVIGGDGSFRGAALLEEEGGPRVIGIPATIDNDIIGTDYALGFDTARNTALDAIDKIRDTAASHDRCFLVEVMGHSAGFLALDVGIAGGAEFVLTPEFPVTITVLRKYISELRRKKQSLIIVIAEAGKPGRTFAIADKLNEHSDARDYKVCVLGHIQRGGRPTVMDRTIASHMGYMAVKFLAEGKSKSMVAMQNNKITLTKFPPPDGKSRILEEEDLLKINKVLSS